MLQLRSIIFATLINLATQSESFAQNNNWSTDLGTPIFASPLLRDLDDDGDLEILISSLLGEVSILDHTGSVLTGWPKDTALFQRTSPSVGDIDGDGAIDIVVGDNDGNLHAWELNGSSKDGFPIKLDGSIKSVVRLIDVNNDGSDEMLIHTGASVLHLIDGNGVPMSGWPIALKGDIDQFGSWTIASSPIVVDFNFDGTLEIAVGTTNDTVQVFNSDGTPFEGWPVSTGDWVYPSLNAVDLDGDYEPELVTGSGDGKLYAWKANGSLASGFPVNIGQPIIASVASADLIPATGPELVIADISGKVYCYTSNGQLLNGWPQSANSGITASPLLVDVNNDGALDIVVASKDNTIHIWNTDGSRINGLSLSATDWIESTPASGDLDNNGTLELIYASYDGLLYCVPLTTLNSQYALAWPSFLGDQANRLNGPNGDWDRDLLPDSYELNYFGSTRFETIDDNDQDGSNNYAEWIAGTNPAQTSDRFSVRGELQKTESNLSYDLEWDAKAGRRYIIYCSESLSQDPDTWEALDDQPDFVSSSDTTYTWRIPIDPDAKAQFYCVRVERSQAFD